MDVVGIPELEVVGSLDLDDIMAEFELIISRCSTVSKSFAVAWNSFFYRSSKFISAQKSSLNLTGKTGKLRLSISSWKITCEDPNLLFIL